MLSPSSNLVTQRPDLDQSFMEYALSGMLEGFVAKRCAPPIYVDKQAGNLGRISIDQLLMTPNIERAQRAGYKRGSWTFKPETYATYERGYEEVVDEVEVEIYGGYMAVEAMTMLRAKRIVLQDYEIDVASTIFNTSSFTGNQTFAPSAMWSARATATPRDDITTARNNVFKASGMWPNALIISEQLFNHLLMTDDITTLIKYSGKDDPKARKITRAALAEALNLDEIIVAGQAQNTADQGQTAALSSIWNPTMAMVCVLCPEESQDYREPSLTRTFAWGGDGASIDGTTESYPDYVVRGEVVRVRTWRQVSLRDANFGCLLTGLAPSGG